MTSLTRNNLEALEGVERLLGMPVAFGWDIKAIRVTQELTPGELADSAARRHAAFVDGALGHAARAALISGLSAISSMQESIGR
jgi:hypothetical protein